MPVTKPSSGGSGGTGGEIAKGLGGLLLISAAVYFVRWLVIKLLWIWAKVKLGFFTLGKFLVCVGALVIFSFIVVLICDALSPLVRTIKKDRERRQAMAMCRLPSLIAFRTGRSEMENEQAAKVDTFMASLLRNRYRELTGCLPDQFTFRNSQSAFSAFKTGELPTALTSNRQQIEQDLFAPLIATYRTNNSHQYSKE